MRKGLQTASLIARENEHPIAARGVRHRVHEAASVDAFVGDVGKTGGGRGVHVDQPDTESG